MVVSSLMGMKLLLDTGFVLWRWKLESGCAGYCESCSSITS